jgi:hypothetical protein
MRSIGEILAPSPPIDTPELRALRKEQLRNKLARFLACRAAAGCAEQFWIIQAGDDPLLAQRVFDQVDTWMRREGWDDAREWKHQHGIAA